MTYQYVFWRNQVRITQEYQGPSFILQLQSTTSGQEKNQIKNSFRLSCQRRSLTGHSYPQTNFQEVQHHDRKPLSIENRQDAQWIDYMPRSVMEDGLTQVHEQVISTETTMSKSPKRIYLVNLGFTITSKGDAGYKYNLVNMHVIQLNKEQMCLFCIKLTTIILDC